jgi:hypothetical protein
MTDLAQTSTQFASTEEASEGCMRTPIRYVTGHDRDGRAVISREGPSPLQVPLEAIPGTVFHEIWCTSASPAQVDNAADPIRAPLRLGPPSGGTRVRIVDIPPDTPEFLASSGERMASAFAQIGDASASTVADDSPHPLMHRTETLDYGIVVEGEVVMILDSGERTLRPGDVVVQRGTNHAWANRSGRMSRMVFVLLDGRYADELAHLRGAR